MTTQQAQRASRGDIAIIGAGIVGLCSALFLLRAGRAVTVIDSLPPGCATSFGNAGMLSVDQNTPVALPGMISQVPRWLSDPLGPLVVRPSYLPRAMPWLLRWLMASRMKAVLPASDALRALHKGSHDRYRELLGNTLFRDLINLTGSISVYESAEAGLSERVTRQLIQRHDIETQDLNRDDLQQLVPGLGSSATRGMLFPRNGHTVNPSRLTATLADLVRQEGGQIVNERVMKILPKPDASLELLTNIDNRFFGEIVVAAGAWSKTLLGPLGIKLPLDTERGYHIMLSDPSVSPRLPLLFKDRGLSITPMEHGLRVGGTVEIAGLDAAPDERRARCLMQHARDLFPALRSEKSKIWMGFRPSFPDSVPAIGKLSGFPNIVIAAGHGHTGMVGASETGRLVRDLVLGQAPAIDPKPYSPGRF